MQVLLRENLARLGRRGEVVTVKDGYARNFLLPKGIAIEVRPDDLDVIEAEKKRLEKIARQERLEAEALAEKLREASVTITARANEEGHLFGSVGPDEIAAALSAEVHQVAPSAVRLEKHIKELGVYEVTVHVSGDYEVVTKVWVVGE
ncbi:MAG: 50S ribosomal protein L9 [Planctomycetota bacterium]|jgi:large subunit ribosomal protein L9